MPELAFHDPHNRRFRSSYGGARDVSPDSLISPFESTFTLFSSSASASASVERSSSPSDVLDHDSLVSSDVSLHSSSGGFRGSSSERSSDPDPKRNSAVRINGGPYLLGKKVDKAEAIKEHVDANDGENQTLFSARSSFSYKESKDRKSRSEIRLTKPDRRRPASLDLNNQAMSITSYSPRLGSSMKTSASARRRGLFPSPGTPNHHPASFGIQKGWSSERVPLHADSNRTPLMPYNNRKTLPSKWEDAERWIISPVAGENALKPSGQQQKRPKSKSGPLGPHGSACYSMYSPAVPNFERGHDRGFITESPHLTGANADYNSLIEYQNGNFSSLMDHCIARSVSLQGCSELPSHSLLLITQDDKAGSSVDTAINISHDASRRDMATQMSPESNPCSSPRKTTSSSILAIDLPHVCSSKSDMRDVQVDDQVKLTHKYRGQIPGRGSNIVDDSENEDSEMRRSLSKVQREEAKITAWEELQKAKADAAIRKLEMKLEKKRSSSMDRIIHKLQSAQKKAEEMRESVSNQPHRVAKSSHKAISLIKTRHVRFLTGCFTCPAF
ncbi:hypothetical protein SSX86_024985 [Deinandra increscens subsp. villosa]|uniref:Remorin C-terminal domain-containing protein n=1 Tax=Deinandra increscens subsp. villosa TaxID=3103831 RepID=A0AAP0GNJ7_9ASTR